MRAAVDKPGLTAGPLGLSDQTTALAEEMPIALVYNGTTLAVMMGSPADLIDFAVGFSLTEGLVDSADELGEVEVIRHAQGVELQMWLPEERAAAMAKRRRALAGPVGCGLCGVESLEQAMRALPRVTADLRLRRQDIHLATTTMRQQQPLHDETHAAHAAGFYRPGDGLILVREDVGRHNALDKLAGALALAGIDASTGAITVTSRLSSEMIQKTAQIGAPVLIAVSAPTALGVDLADQAGLTLVTRARGTRFDVFTHTHRIHSGEPQ